MEVRKSIFRLSRSQWISIAVLASSMGLAIAVSIPNSFTAGTPISASQMNANFSALGTAVTATEAGLATKANSADVYTKAETDAALATKANSADVYTKAATDAALATKANSADVYTKAEIDASIANALLATGEITGLGTKSTSFPTFGNYTPSRFGVGSYGITLPGLRPGCVGLFPVVSLSNGFGMVGTVSMNSIQTLCTSGDVTLNITTRNSAFAAADGPFTFILYRKATGSLPPFPAIARHYTVCRIEPSGVEACE